VANAHDGLSRCTCIPGGWRLSILLGLTVLPGLVAGDHSLMTAARMWRWPPLVELMQVLTWLGYGAVDIGVLLVLGLCGWWREDCPLWMQGLAGAGTVAGAGLLDQLVKNVACRARPMAPGAGAFFTNFPCFPAPYATASFPSGHATTAFATAVVLALWYPRGTGVFVGLAVLVGVSRVMLGAHFPSDVLAGALLGSGVALAVHAHISTTRRRKASAASQ
jgi:membrane-associated phospholipid phosphatase